MAKRSLYLHEVVDVVGQGQYDYMEHLWQDPVLRMPEMNNLLGSFYVCAQGGGRWPQVINIWDCGDKGWESWGRNVDRLNLKRRNAFYGDWWDKASQWRRTALSGAIWIRCNWRIFHREVFRRPAHSCCDSVRSRVRRHRRDHRGRTSAAHQGALPCRHHSRIWPHGAKLADL